MDLVENDGVGVYVLQHVGGRWLQAGIGSGVSRQEHRVRQQDQIERPRHNLLL